MTTAADAVATARVDLYLAELAESMSRRGIAHAVLALGPTAWPSLPPSVRDAVEAYDDATAAARAARETLRTTLAESVGAF
jgi:acetyl-CoA acetyltransferase